MGWAFIGPPVSFFSRIIRPDPDATHPRFPSSLPPPAGVELPRPSRAQPVLPSLDAMEPERPPPALVSELLEEIFLRVASPADLARASAACVSFRRLIADPSFLRRYRSVHPPLLLGLVSSYGFQPVEAPHPSAAVGRAVAFSFDFLPHTPKRDSWYPRDIRDGRILVECPREEGLVWDLAVCDPLSRRYLLLPRITDDLLASIGIHESLFDWGASFIPSRGVEEDTSFSVISWIQSESRLGIFTFSSRSGCWTVSTSTNWGDLGLDQPDMMISVSGQCAYDCFYWKLYDLSTVIKLDMNSMQFCTIGLPPRHDDREIAIVESGASEVAMFSLLKYGGTSVDYYTFPQNGSEKSHEWHMISTIPLPDHCTRQCCINGLAEGYIFIECLRGEEDTTYSTFFSLEIKSFNIERVGRTSFFPGRKFFYAGTYPYFGFPPSLSPRRI